MNLTFAGEPLVLSEKKGNWMNRRHNFRVFVKNCTTLHANFTTYQVKMLQMLQKCALKGVRRLMLRPQMICEIYLSDFIFHIEALLTLYMI